MIGRESIWSDAEVQKLAAQFVAAADEVWFLQNTAGPEGEWFRAAAEQGHYGGRPNSTRQGIYAVAPSGTLLASMNHNDPRRVAKMLRSALAKWEGMSDAERLEGAPAGDAPWRWERLYPRDGLVLRVNTRDLPRDQGESNWKTRAWNQDYAWFRRDEMSGFLPVQRAPGATRTVPALITDRLARLHLIDTVRGQSPAFPKGSVERATMTATITHVRDGLLGVRLAGDVRLLQQGKWRIGGLDDRSATDQARGVEGRWLGRAVYDTASGRFAAFELVWLGKRWGATRYNCRSDDTAPAAMGVAFTLAGDTPAERVAPAQLWSYGWKHQFKRRQR